jgi:hypothetical protein
MLAYMMSTQGACGPRHKKINNLLLFFHVGLRKKTQFFNPNLAENLPVNTIAFIQKYSLKLGGSRGR